MSNPNLALDDTVPAPATTWPGVAALMAAAALWSLSGFLIKLLHTQGPGLSGVAITSYRAILAGLVFLPAAWRRRRELREIPPLWAIVAMAAFTLMSVTFVVATTRTAAASVIILQYTAPLWVFLLSPLVLKERPCREDGLALLVSLAGMVVIFFGSRAGDLASLSLALGSGVSFAVLTLALRGLRHVAPVLVVCMNCLCCGPLLLPLAGVQPALRLVPSQWEILTLLSVVQFALAYALFSWGLRHIEAHRASLSVLLEPILNPLWAFLALGERIPGATAAGGPLILLGVAGWIWLNWRRERK